MIGCIAYRQWLTLYVGYVLCFIALYMCIGLCAGSFLLFWTLIEFLFYFYRMPPRKEKAVPKERVRDEQLLHLGNKPLRGL